MINSLNAPKDILSIPTLIGMNYDSHYRIRLNAPKDILSIPTFDSKENDMSSKTVLMPPFCAKISETTLPNKLV